MFGASSEIIKSQFSFPGRNSVCNDDIFMYIMDAILHRSQDSIVIKNKSILENVLYTSNKKLSKYENLQKVNVNMFLSPVHKDTYTNLFSLSQGAYFGFFD